MGIAFPIMDIRLIFRSLKSKNCIFVSKNGKVYRIGARCQMMNGLNLKAICWEVKMKARVKTDLEKLSWLERSEIMRINKIWMIALHNKLNYGQNGLMTVYSEVCKIAGELYEDPEHWDTVDELLCGKYDFEDFLPREDVDEREKIARELHKEHGKKWRQY